MRATGITRRIDDLGRVVIPRDIRRSLKIQEGEPLEIYTDETGVYFKKMTSFDTTDLIKVLDTFINNGCGKSDEVKCIATALQMMLTKEIENEDE